MKKKYKIIIALIIGIVILSNTPPAQYIIIIFERENGYYTYASKNAPNSFYSEHLMGPWELAHFSIRKDSVQFMNYLKEHPRAVNDTLYRTFTKNSLFFWHWWAYFFDKRYTLPYKSREDFIEIGRIKNKV